MSQPIPTCPKCGCEVQPDEICGFCHDTGLFKYRPLYPDRLRVNQAKAEWGDHQVVNLSVVPAFRRRGHYDE